MTYTIIEDCSPYYIRYTFEGLDKLIAICNRYPLPDKNHLGFRHVKVGEQWAQAMLNLVPASKQMPLKQDRVSLFLTEPGFYYGAHKDGEAERFSLNFTSMILDDSCVTSWYSDDDTKDCTVTTHGSPSLGISFNQPNSSRELKGWDKSKHTPVKSMTAKQNEAILFNTDLFHDFDNSLSNNRRVVLTLRHAEPDNVYFEDARKIMFGY